MNPVLVVVADGEKANFLTLKEKDVEGEFHPYLVEDKTLLNPEQKLSGQQLWAGAASQAGHFQEGKSQAHSYDDRRQDHEVEFERRFAHLISEQILSQTHQLHHLLLIAEPRLLGLLREALIPALPKTLKLRELDKNLCHLKPQELYEYLADRHLLAQD
ncbi:MAG: host attachment protein [Oscillatoriophycideae cyanobacterium NC_groundwater_1537_Pr4_S-0.65um_50_18]|nr:host attachment protein [Oscillatoriophycideae cyanobacterium NC_groundwater_1537_Pr4_S-0.65um_50_18]